MHYDEHNRRQPHYREMRHRRDHERHHPHQEHFQDFRSRWEEPEPLIRLTHQNWDQRNMDHPQNHQRFVREDEDWHDPRHNRYVHEYQEPERHQRDQSFDRDNQRVEDRWSEGDAQMMPHPRHRNDWDRGRRPHPRDRYWDENEY